MTGPVARKSQDTDHPSQRRRTERHSPLGARRILKGTPSEAEKRRSAMEGLWKKHWETFHNGGPGTPGQQREALWVAFRDSQELLPLITSLVLRRSCYSHLGTMTDLVAVWEVALSDGIHKIEFEHGTTSGKRVVYVDGKEEIRREWMFKLVGKETFSVGAAKTKATINIDAVSGFAYEYTLEIDGKSLKKYMENRSKTTNTWVLRLDGVDFRIVLEKDTMDVWCNGKKLETAGEFVDDGTETHFNIDNHNCYIKAVSSGKRKEGIIHTLIVDDKEIAETLE